MAHAVRAAGCTGHSCVWIGCALGQRGRSFWGRAPDPTRVELPNKSPPKISGAGVFFGLLEIASAKLFFLCACNVRRSTQRVHPDLKAENCWPNKWWYCQKHGAPPIRSDGRQHDARRQHRLGGFLRFALPSHHWVTCESWVREQIFAHLLRCLCTSSQNKVWKLLPALWFGNLCDVCLACAFQSVSSVLNSGAIWILTAKQSWKERSFCVWSFTAADASKFYVLALIFAAWARRF